MESKTVIEWLEQAKAEGYEWAERAIELADECMPREKRDSKPSSMAVALEYAFDWSNSSEGFDFWDKIWLDVK